jgi:hypothetical protein
MVVHHESLCCAGRYASQLIHGRVVRDLRASRDVSGSTAVLTTTCELVLSIAETLGAAEVYSAKHPHPGPPNGEVDQDGVASLAEAKQLAQVGAVSVQYGVGSVGSPRWRW